MPRSHYLFPKTTDPYWLTVRYKCRCNCCERTIVPGERAFYWPLSKTMDCSRDTCGGKSSSEFNAAVQDESLLLNQFPR